MFGSSYKIARVWGIPIKVDLSLIVLLLFFSFDFGILKGLLMAAGLLASIVLHELGHSLVAIRKGCRVREITLMFIGGAAQMERIPTKPLDEALMAIAGPAVSLLIGSLCLLGGAYLPASLFAYAFNYVQWLGWVNLALLVFNLIPAFPMDGGRVLRSALTPKFGRLKATLIASRLGKAFALFFGIFGLYHNAWTLIVIAFFIFVSAGNEYRHVQMQEAARRQGFGAWPPFDAPSASNADEDDQVTISPPPYEKGPGTRTEIHPADDNSPFRNVFGR